MFIGCKILLHSLCVFFHLLLVYLSPSASLNPTFSSSTSRRRRSLQAYMGARHIPRSVGQWNKVSVVWDCPEQRRGLSRLVRGHQPKHFPHPFPQVRAFRPQVLVTAIILAQYPVSKPLPACILRVVTVFISYEQYENNTRERATETDSQRQRERNTHRDRQRDTEGG